MRNTQIFPIDFINVFSMVRLIEYNSYYSDHSNAFNVRAYDLSKPSRLSSSSSSNCQRKQFFDDILLWTHFRENYQEYQNNPHKFCNRIYSIHFYCTLHRFSGRGKGSLFIINVNYIICKKGDPIIVLAWRS